MIPVLQMEDRPEDSAAVKAAKAAVRAKFIAYEMPEDFVSHLRADRDAIADANRVNRGENQEGVANTALIGQLLGQINNTVAELDAVMFNKYTRQPEKLRAWQSASHVERAPRHGKKPASEPTPPAQ